MKLLQNKDNVTAPGGDFPFGTMKDDTGSDDGSRADTEFMTDYVQFFEKLFADSALTANGLPDDDNNGFQIYKAFRKLTRPYSVYTALISQAGGAAPTVTILGHNDIGTIVWTRNVAGQYLGTLVGAFKAVETFYQITTGVNGGQESFIRRISDDVMQIDTNLAGVPADGVLQSTPIEIRVYDVDITS